MSRHQNWLEFRVDIEIGLISVMGRNWLDFCVGDRNAPVFVLVVEIESISVWGSNLTWILCRDRNWLGCVGVGKYLVLVSGLKLGWFLCRGIEIDLVIEWGSNWLHFSGVEIELIFVWRIEFHFVLVLGSKLTCFCAGGRGWLRGPKMTCV